MIILCKGRFEILHYSKQNSIMCNTGGLPMYVDLQILLTERFSTLLSLSAIALATL